MVWVPSLSMFLERILSRTRFRGWFFGHYHLDEDFGEFTCLYYKVVPLED